MLGIYQVVWKYTGRNMTKDYISNMVTLIGYYSQLNKLKNAKDRSDVLSKPVTYNRVNTRALVS